jgi:uncharacterized protein YbjT (DUF2867 family)
LLSQTKKKIMKYVLAGSLGHINKPLAIQLVNAGNDVTIISSNAERKQQIEAIGAKAAIGSVEDVNFLTNIFKGADAVFTLIPPVADAADWKEYIHSIGKNYAEAIKASGVKKVVNLSSIGAHMPDGSGPITGLHRAELELNKLENVDIKHLRPGIFFTNLLGMTGMVKHAGIYGNNYGADRELVFTHPNDIAAVAAEELLNPDFTGKSIRYIASDKRTGPEIAAVLGKAVGKPELPYVPFTDEQALTGTIQAGIPEELARNFTEMGKALRSGELTADYEKYPVELGKTKLEDFAVDFAKAYAEA